jgi:hypothetical protein
VEPVGGKNSDATRNLPGILTKSFLNLCQVRFCAASFTIAEFLNSSVRAGSTNEWGIVIGT